MTRMQNLYFKWNIFDPRLRDKFMLLMALGLAALMLTAFALVALKEQGGSNSYALVADSLLNLRPDVPTCFDKDCAVRDGKTYVIFPPFPGVVAMPLVSLFGPDASGFMLIAGLALAASLVIWNRIFQHMGLLPSIRFWLLLGLACASPLFFVTMRSNTVWFFAQAIAFPLASLAVHETLAKRFVTAGIAVGLAFLCRQMSIFIAPVLFVMAFAPGSALFSITRDRIMTGLKMGMPIAAALVAYFIYNYWRFGSPLDTGYANMIMPDGILKNRVAENGIWSAAYFIFNTFYLFIQGFHADFDVATRTQLTGLDHAGTGILAASPWLLYMLLTPLKREHVVGALMIAGVTFVTLFYHSNGFAQYNTQRYVLDWLPVGLVLIAAAFTPGEMRAGRAELLKPLVIWGMTLNVVMLVVLAVTKTGAA